jgi:hypothetical protein
VTPAELEDKARTALADLFGSDGTMLTRFVLVSEIIEADGTSAVWTCTSEDLSAWDSLGLLSFAEAKQRGEIYAEQDDDE